MAGQPGEALADKHLGTLQKSLKKRRFILPWKGPVFSHTREPPAGAVQAAPRAFVVDGGAHTCGRKGRLEKELGSVPLCPQPYYGP